MKSKKILSIFLVVIVITTLFVPLFSFNSFAVEENNEFIPSGSNIYFNSDELTLYPNIQIGDEIEVFFNCETLIGNHSFVGMRFRYRNTFGDNVRFTVDIIKNGDDGYIYSPFYNDYSGLIDGFILESYKFLRFNTDVTDTYFVQWINENCVYLTDIDAAYYVIGYDFGYSQGDYFGYERGFNEGVTIGESGNFGDNLLGDTLSAPVKALDSFVLYETSSGFEITLWGVFSTVLAVGLTIWFIKMFAGG